MRKRGKIISSDRVTLGKEFMEKHGLQEGDFCELDDLTKDPEHPKIVIEFFKIGKRGP